MKSYYRLFYQLPGNPKTLLRNDHVSTSEEGARLKLINSHTEQVTVLNVIHVQDAEVQKNVDARRGPQGVEGTAGG